MTEQEWLECSDPQLMLGVMRDRASPRKWRLLACAFCRRIWHMFRLEYLRNAVEIAEKYADRQATRKHLDKAATAAACCGLDRHEIHTIEDAEIDCASTAAVNAADRKARADFAAEAVWEATYDPAEKLAQCRLTLDIFGNPFRNVAIDPSWKKKGGTILKLAQAIYAERDLSSGLLDNSRLAILADALEESGCTDATILGHCRQGGEHVRGCWVVDLLLGKQ